MRVSSVKGPLALKPCIKCSCITFNTGLYASIASVKFNFPVLTDVSFY